MSTEEILANDDICEMTAVPGGIIECVDNQAAISILRDSPIVNSDSPQYLQALSPLTLPIRIDNLNRCITLTNKPLSYEYQNQIMNFKSAYAPLLQFLQTDSFLYEEIGNTCTTLFFENNTNELVGFCSTKCSSLKIKGTNVLSLCPSVEVAALCIDENYRYLGIGQAIFNHTIQQIYKIKNVVGVQFITLFALPESVPFYQKFDFRKLEKGMKVLYTAAHECCVPMYFNIPHITIKR